MFTLQTMFVTTMCISVYVCVRKMCLCVYVKDRQICIYLELHSVLKLASNETSQIILDQSTSSYFIANGEEREEMLHACAHNFDEVLQQ